MAMGSWTEGELEQKLPEKYPIQELIRNQI